MIVMLRDEEREIDDAHWLIQPRMETGALHKSFVVRVQPGDESHPLLAKSRQDVFDRVRVVMRFVRLAISQVGRK